VKFEEFSLKLKNSSLHKA